MVFFEDYNLTINNIYIMWKPYIYVSMVKKKKNLGEGMGGSRL
jgi:hypothetical protein